MVPKEFNHLHVILSLFKYNTGVNLSTKQKCTFQTPCCRPPYIVSTETYSTHVSSCKSSAVSKAAVGDDKNNKPLSPSALTALMTYYQLYQSWMLGSNSTERRLDWVYGCCSRIFRVGVRFPAHGYMSEEQLRKYRIHTKAISPIALHPLMLFFLAINCITSPHSDSSHTHTHHMDRGVSCGHVREKP